MVVHSEDAAAAHVSPDMAVELPEVMHLREQIRRLMEAGMPQRAGEMTDAESGSTFLVLVKIEDLRLLKRSWERVHEILSRSKMRSHEVEPKQAGELFAEGLTEFLVAARTGVAGDTIVNSRRRGDTVLYSKGYFLSTGTAFGTSTPARGHLAAGRYSFGIMENGMTRYDPVLWTCPAVVTLNQP